MAASKISLPSAGVLSQIFQQVRVLAQGNLGVPFMLMLMLGMMTLPVPTLLLDIFFTFNIALAIVVLMVSIYAARPLDFAIFPSVLLVATLLRLALNVASTRVVLLEGHEGGAAAGKVIEAFGEVLVGGNYAVGLVVFLILMIINFVVVTKGAGRVSEVSARFTLDAMPGKQMAIDADLNAGLIDADQAKTRRADVANEADFYGSMDGASKFVKGDAVAGMLILIINILGGLAIGMVQHDLDFSRATEVYALLTIGDGLVAQYDNQSVTRSIHREAFLMKIPIRDYGEVSSLTENIMVNDLASDVNETLFDHHNYASVSATGVAVDGVVIYPSYNNSLNVAQTAAELSAHGMHSGRGLGAHYHADAHSATNEGLNLYNASDYVGHSHPPIVSMGFDGVAGYGVYLQGDTSSDGVSVSLDDFGGHEHGDYAYHYHSYAASAVTDTGNGPDDPEGGVSYIAHQLPPLGAWAGKINDIPEFWDGTSPNYVGGRSSYLGTQ